LTFGDLELARTTGALDLDLIADLDAHEVFTNLKRPVVGLSGAPQDFVEIVVSRDKRE
jgi:hypothetical protein